MRKFLPILVLSLVACGGSDEETDSLIRAIESLDFAVQIETFESFPGVEIHGEGNGPGGGDTCGNIMQVNAYPYERRLENEEEEELIADGDMDGLMGYDDDDEEDFDPDGFDFTYRNCVEHIDRFKSRVAG